MKKELRDNWCAALRSGEYRQGTGKLRYKSGSGPDLFCCLGVLADLSGAEWRADDDGDTYQLWIGAKQAGLATLWGPALELTGLDNDMAIRLADLNDGGKTFEHIAAEIEKLVPVEE